MRGRRELLECCKVHDLRGRGLQRALLLMMVTVLFLDVLPSDQVTTETAGTSICWSEEV